MTVDVSLGIDEEKHTTKQPRPKVATDSTSAFTGEMCCLLKAFCEISIVEMR